MTIGFYRKAQIQFPPRRQEEVVALRERVRQLEAANGTLLKDLSRSQARGSAGDSACL